MLCKLKDIIHRVKDNVDAQNTELEFYIGGEHFDNGEVLITKKGVIKGSTIGPAFHMRFKSGQVLLMSRNPHLRKAGMVDFEGICSDVSYVCETNDEQKFKQRLIPFLFQSDVFWKTAEANKKGSTNFFLNWSDFEKFEFNVPEPEEQEKLADLLWAAEEARQAYKKLIKQTDDLINAKFIELFVLNNSDECYKKSLQELIDKKWITYHLDGNHGGDYPRSDEFVESGVPYISANCIVDGVVDMRFAKYVTKERAQRFRKGIAQNGDVLFAHNATVGPVALLKTTEPVVVLGTSLTAFRCDTKHIIPEYLMSFMKHPMFINQYESDMQQTTRKQVPITTQRKYNFIIPPVEKQKVFANFVQQAEQTKLATQQSLDALNETVRALVNRNFN